ncbi:hypothetical protein TRICI_002684 [Trichomonascus ciferrii]|uniref:Uncharacterized protein n=1 Tax=Trichomonascus ciferrii TaxID=44093 RepID=A0A642V644_9ASCO|nr:hypothetical protein TRICI_002684 [Trichomonascus ciferrii]
MFSFGSFFIFALIISITQCAPVDIREGSVEKRQDAFDAMGEDFDAMMNDVMTPPPGSNSNYVESPDGSSFAGSYSGAY